MKFLQNLYELFYPSVCLACKDNLVDTNTHLCIHCRHDLPLTSFCNKTDNALERSFFGRIRIDQATALLYYSKKGIVQELIHALKYKNQQSLGIFFGEWLGANMMESQRFKNLEYIVPVPLDKKKQRNRGYNQLSVFGKSLAGKLKIPFIENNLVKIVNTNSQTKKLRWERLKNVDENFKVLQPSKFENKQILLIDDIVTTGATIEACFEALNKDCNLKISLACIAFTK